MRQSHPVLVHRLDRARAAIRDAIREIGELDTYEQLEAFDAGYEQAALECALGIIDNVAARNGEKPRNTPPDHQPREIHVRGNKS